ncbi:hypothetical protein C3492_36120 [Streptomyces sp. Ru62]|uniref:SgcJ/EcaC family oxidoreductase n=1 Tax=Streptomyces sp. Ru62 TaxID=2080745 RepID=UPI000CDD079B|nr:SgcJ/EcaC family oxidoreductase [Streptomyces sp. Ru62]POX58789.1 hypothetical protein C3492_36120 [Streptomyces sp. Ru62]
MSGTAAPEAVLRGVVDQWKSAVDAHEPEKVAALFTEDAIFQGLRPCSVGRPGVAAYYDSQPIGLTAEYQVLETRSLADDVLLGYLDVDFRFTDRPAIHVALGIVLKRVSDRWYISHYQVTRLG